LQNALLEQAGDRVMKLGLGALFLGAAVMSLFASGKGGATRSRKEKLDRQQKPSRLLVLVQTRPQVMVLAASESREELERELQELNETWNHWEIRTERQRYEIQPAPVLQPAGDPAPGRARPSLPRATGASSGNGRQDGPRPDLPRGLP
jgi:hypothetical protein